VLQKLDTVLVNRLLLADALGSMDPSDFDMRITSNCICGHALRMFGKQEHFYFGWQTQLAAGASLLGLSTVQAVELFAPPDRSGSDEPYTSPQDAARVVRYLAHRHG
jgi:hypothetical protein